MYGYDNNAFYGDDANWVDYESAVEIDTLTKSDIQDLIARLAYLFPQHVCEPKRIFSIIDSFKSDVFTVIAENEYVDKTYRELYYECYSQMYEQYERNCVRLTFFDDSIDGDVFSKQNENVRSLLNNALIGTLVLRPLQIGNVGTTFLNPHKLKIKGYFRTCRYEFMAYGYKLQVECFPHSSQDSMMMSCAENAIYNLIYYFGKKYSDYRVVMPYEMQQRIETESYQRVFPSVGLYEEEIAKVLLSNHLYPKIYHYKDELSDSFERLMYYYAESGIPFLLNLPGHTVTVVGHENSMTGIIDLNSSANMRKRDRKSYFLSAGAIHPKFIVMDDNLPPYALYDLKEMVRDKVTAALDIEHYDEEKTERIINKKINEAMNSTVSMIVPLYKRIFLDADMAYAILKSTFFTNKVFLDDVRREYNDPSWGTKDNPFVFRLFLCTAHNFKHYKNKTTPNQDLRHFYNSAFMAKMIWVCEMTSLKLYKDQNPKARVEILLDATASTGSYLRGIMYVRYKNHMITSSEVINDYRERYEEGEEAEEEKAALITTWLASSTKSDFDYMRDLMITRMFDLLRMKVFVDDLEDAIAGEYLMYVGSNLKGG